MLTQRRLLPVWQLDFNLGACNAVKCYRMGILVLIMHSVK